MAGNASANPLLQKNPPSRDEAAVAQLLEDIKEIISLPNESGFRFIKFLAQRLGMGAAVHVSSSDIYHNAALSDLWQEIQAYLVMADPGFMLKLLQDRGEAFRKGIFAKR